jgi:Tol biopolymer transport system component
VYVEPGYLLYARNGRIVAHRFDAGRRKLIGEPVALVDEPKRTEYLGSPSLIAALRGPLAYFRQISTPTRLAWFDRTGLESEPLPLAPGLYENVVLSPGGERAVVARRSSPSESDLWLVDLRRMATTRLTHGPGQVDRPLWSPDGARVAFSTDRGGHWDIYEKAVDGAGAEQPLMQSGSLLKYADAWSPDGQTLVYEQIGEKTGWDLWIVSTQGDRTSRPLLVTPFDEQYASLSRDGRWIAYVSNESGRGEVYIQAFPGLGRKHQVSTSGGAQPKWRGDSRAIVFGSGPGATIVDVSPDGGIGNSRTIQPVADIVSADPAADFGRFIGLVRVGGARVPDDLTIVLNWRSELTRR